MEAPRITGKLRDGVQIIIEGLYGRATNKVGYNKYVIKGTPAHTIGSAIWILQIPGWRYIGLSPLGNGKPHPGTKPNDYMGRGRQKAEPNIQAELSEFTEWICR
jgi:hypothetical protein